MKSLKGIDQHDSQRPAIVSDTPCDIYIPSEQGCSCTLKFHGDEVTVKAGKCS